MAPSATEGVTKIAEQVKEKTIPSSKPSNGSNGSHSADGSNGSGISGGQAEELPKLNTAHREPLKPTGVLDKFEQFDVTPVIGREFVDVDLAEWLKAPNSDELLRELAITGNDASPLSPFLPYLPYYVKLFIG